MIEDLPIDTELGELLRENEDQIASDIASAIAAKIQQGQRPALRDAHPNADATQPDATGDARDGYQAPRCARRKDFVR